jgi:hypothetical protein
MRVFIFFWKLWRMTADFKTEVTWPYFHCRNEASHYRCEEWVDQRLEPRGQARTSPQSMGNKQ